MNNGSLVDPDFYFFSYSTRAAGSQSGCNYTVGDPCVQLASPSPSTGRAWRNMGLLQCIHDKGVPWLAGGGPGRPPAGGRAAGAGGRAGGSRDGRWSAEIRRTGGAPRPPAIHPICAHKEASTTASDQSWASSGGRLLPTPLPL